MSPVTRELTDFLRTACWEHVPPDCIETAKLCLLDFLGVAVPGAREPSARILQDFIGSLGGPAEATILGDGKKSSALHAALANGTSGHALDFDDDSSNGAGHLTTCVAPALLALAEKFHLGGSAVLLAFVLAYEVGGLLAQALEPEETLRGWHATATIGTFAATAGAARLLNLDEGEIAQAFGIAATQTSGLRRSFGTMCKPLHAGKAAQRGVESALLARMGFTADGTVFDGKWGVTEVFAGKSVALKRSGLHIRENWFKRYPSCACSHSALDAAIHLRGRCRIDPLSIERIEVGVVPVALDTLVYARPQTPYQAKFSMPFCVSLGLLEGKASPDRFTETMLHDATMQRLMEKVEMSVDPDLAAGEYRGTYGATLRVGLTNGDILEEKVQAPRGHPRNPLPAEALAAKFRDCTQPFLPSARIDSAADIILNLEKVENVAELMESFFVFSPETIV